MLLSYNFSFSSPEKAVDSTYLGSFHLNLTLEGPISEQMFTIYQHKNNKIIMEPAGSLSSQQKLSKICMYNKEREKRPELVSNQGNLAA